MIGRNRLKRTIAEVLLLAVIAAVAGVLTLAGHVLSATSTGADFGTALHVQPAVPPDAGQLVGWLPDVNAGRRALEPSTRSQLEASYIDAWQGMDIYQQTGGAGEAETYFGQPALAAVLALPHPVQAVTWPIHHQLRLTFYSDDGATAAVSDVGATVARTSAGAGAQTVLTDREDFEAVFVLQDGYWRVAQLRRGGTRDLQTVSVSTGSAVVTPSRPVMPPRAVPSLTGVGYVPSGAPLGHDWLDYSDTSVRVDLARIRSYGFDTIRLVLPPAGPTALSPVRVQRLGHLLSLASAADLHVALVLLPAGAPQGPDQWAAEDSAVTVVLRAVATDPALRLVDVAEDPDLSASLLGPAVEQAWLLHEIATVRAVDDRTPLTVTWGAPDAALDSVVDGQLDAVSLQWRSPAGALGAAVGPYRATGRPVLLSSVGLDAYAGWTPGGRTAQVEARYVADVLTAARRAGVGGVVARAWEDPIGGPGLVSGSGGHQTAIGLIAADGAARPTAGLYRPGVDLAAVAYPGLTDRLSEPFWRLALVIAVLTGVATDLLTRRRRRLRRSPTP